MVSVQRGFGGQNLGVKFGKFKNADLHHGLSGFCGDRLALDVPIIGKLATAFIKQNSKIPPKIKIFFVASHCFKSSSPCKYWEEREERNGIHPK